MKIQMDDQQVEHKTGGNGWVIVECIDKEYCRVVSVGKKELGTAALLAYKPLLSRETILRGDFPNRGPKPMPADYVPHMVPDTCLPQLHEIRDGIISGKLTIKATRIVPVK